ncbi:hypothetical protein BJV74DRAFT_767405 [Russula compacta]|nr:hypothetical protein BJV74DRAFT_767405 [Russula compacta]
MADVRALLKAKRQEARINHPYASYGANGALRCTACGVAIKFASAWEGHLGSKAHRVALANLRAKATTTKEEEEEEDQMVVVETRATALSKRKAAEEQQQEGDGRDGGQMENKKRQRTEEREAAPPGAGASRPFPMDFFSDPARAPPPTRDDEDEDEMDQDQEQEQGEGGIKATAAPKSQFETEWAAFERDLQSLRSHPPNANEEEEGSTTITADAPQEMYAGATIAVEPELVPKFVGLPPGSGSGAGAGAAEMDEGGGAGATAGAGAGAEAKAEGEERKRKEVEERELIMDRLLEEERAQEDAYNRVSLLKNRVQMFKRKRELAKAKGKQADAAQT